MVVGGGAAMEAQGSSSLIVSFLFKFKGFDDVFGAGAAMDPHKSSSSFFVAFAVFFGRKLVATIWEIGSWEGDMEVGI